MPLSMTGYGRGCAERGGFTAVTEIRSVNHRYFDCSVRVPRIYIFLEEPVKSAIQRHVSRGKLDVFISIEPSGEPEVDISLNRAALRGYMRVFDEMKTEFGICGDMRADLAARLPDVVNVRKTEADIDELKACVMEALGTALEEFNRYREAEGGRLADDISARCEAVAELNRQIERRSPEALADYRARLELRMKEVLESLDEQRILAEAAIFADRTAINEETVRLRSHTEAMREMLREKKPVGRKMDFLVQEMHREANTISSKGNDLDTAKLCVELKSEIEKIREQVQNIE